MIDFDKEVTLKAHILANIRIHSKRLNLSSDVAILNFSKIFLIIKSRDHSFSAFFSLFCFLTISGHGQQQHPELEGGWRGLCVPEHDPSGCGWS